MGLSAIHHPQLGRITENTNHALLQPGLVTLQANSSNCMMSAGSYSG